MSCYDFNEANFLLDYADCPINLLKKVLASSRFLFLDTLLILLTKSMCMGTHVPYFFLILLKLLELKRFTESLHSANSNFFTFKHFRVISGNIIKVTNL